MTKMVANQITFEQLETKIDTLVIRSARLPSQVFRRSGSNFFLEFDAFSGARFWGLLTGLAAVSRAETICVFAIDPDPVSYFFMEFGVYGTVQLASSASADDYYECLQAAPNDSPADALLYNSNVLTWFSPTAEWVVWGERSTGLAVLNADGAHARSTEKLSQETGLRLLSLQQALELSSVNFHSGTIPADWERLLTTNYPAESSAD